VSEPLDTPAYTQHLVEAAERELTELYPHLPVTPQLLEHAICAALAQAARDIDAGQTVRLEYLGSLQRITWHNAQPAFVWRADSYLIERPEASRSLPTSAATS